MLDFLNSFKSLIKIEQVTTDNNVFKLHYKLTVIMLIAFSILLTSKQYFGDPIICDVESRQDVIETFCWITGTFIIQDSLTDKTLAGVGNIYRPFSKKNKEEERTSPVIWQKYYQWVCIIFCIQALFFYMPRYLWKSWEGGRIRLLVQDLSGPLITPGWSNSARYKLLEYLMCGKYTHDMYSVRYTICEVMNFINVLAQIYLMDWVLTGHFSLYGIRVLAYQEVNPMTQVFPKITKCTYDNYGPSGSIQNKDALCVLPLNILNEKLFLILWFWFFIVNIITFLSLIYRAIVIFVPNVRVYLLMAQTRSLSDKQAKVIIHRLSYGDFFLLYHIGKNLNPIIYKELISDIYDFIASGRPLKRTNGYVDNV